MPWTLPEMKLPRQDWWTVHDALLWGEPPNPTLAAEFPDRNVELTEDPTEILTFGPFSDVGFNQIIAPLMHYWGWGSQAIVSQMQAEVLRSGYIDG